MSLFANPYAGLLDEGSEPADVLAFHRSLPGYAPTPLIDAAGLAREHGVGQLLVKHESGRMGLPAFKLLGVSWATRRALDRDVAGAPSPTLEALRARAADGPVRTLAAATDGNHGHAVATVARLLGLSARIFVPAGTAVARIDAIASAGAEVTTVSGSYDDAVAAAAKTAAPHCRVISDTPCDHGGEDTARWVIDGYATILSELEEQLPVGRPDLVVVPVGTGGLCAAVARWLDALPARERPALVAVEPDGAACALASVRAGHVTTIPAAPHHSIMAGLNCGTPSWAAWPALVRGVDAFVTISDSRARAAIRDYDRAGIASGETGAAALGGLLELLVSHLGSALPRRGREPLTIGPRTRVLLLCTEAVTDPEAHARIVGAATTEEP